MPRCRSVALTALKPPCGGGLCSERAIAPLHGNGVHVEAVFLSSAAPIPISSRRAADKVIPFPRQARIMPFFGPNSSFRFLRSMQKTESQNQRASANQQQGPLVPRVPPPYAADLQRRLTGEMSRFQSNNDYRAIPGTGATEASRLGPHADFVPTFQKNADVTSRCEPVATLVATECDDEFSTLETHKGITSDTHTHTQTCGALLQTQHFVRVH